MHTADLLLASLLQLQGCFRATKQTPWGLRLVPGLSPDCDPCAVCSTSLLCSLAGWCPCRLLQVARAGSDTPPSGSDGGLDPRSLANACPAPPPGMGALPIVGLPGAGFPLPNGVPPALAAPWPPPQLPPPPQQLGERGALSLGGPPPLFSSQPLPQLCLEPQQQGGLQGLPPLPNLPGLHSLPGGSAY
jgi:hypothetical protein